jgi:tRNA-2-methylthio-N6-dimethylallyladenosine synthase
MVEVRALAEQGYREVTLIGQTVNSYECEGMTLAGLLRETAKIEGIERIRFTTSHPRNFTSDLIDAIAEEAKICEHVHLPVQSGSDRVLIRRARRYTAGEYRDICGELRRKVSGVAITTDLIVGFPGETEEDFQATMDLMREVEWEGSFIFKYSPRGQTAAARLPGRRPRRSSAIGFSVSSICS